MIVLKQKSVLGLTGQGQLGHSELKLPNCPAPGSRTPTHPDSAAVGPQRVPSGRTRQGRRLTPTRGSETPHVEATQTAARYARRGQTVDGSGPTRSGEEELRIHCMFLGCKWSRLVDPEQKRTNTSGSVSGPELMQGTQEMFPRTRKVC